MTVTLRQSFQSFLLQVALVPVLMPTTLPDCRMYFQRVNVVLGQSLLSARPLRSLTLTTPNPQPNSAPLGQLFEIKACLNCSFIYCQLVKLSQIVKLLKQLSNLQSFETNIFNLNKVTSIYSQMKAFVTS